MYYLFSAYISYREEKGLYCGSINECKNVNVYLPGLNEKRIHKLIAAKHEVQNCKYLCSHWEECAGFVWHKNVCLFRTNAIEIPDCNHYMDDPSDASCFFKSTSIIPIYSVLSSVQYFRKSRLFSFV